MGDPEPAKRERRFALSSLTAKIGAVGATIATLVGLLFVFVPSLQPTVRHCGETASGDISQIRVEQGTFADYLSLSDRPTREKIDGIWVPRQKSELRTRGNILLYKATIEGFRNEPVELRWSLLTAKDDALIGKPRSTLTYTSPRCSLDQIGSPIWIPGSRSTGNKKLYAEILLYDASDKLPNKRLVESGRSPAFVGAAPGL